MEIFGGLSALHVAYWSLTTGAMKDNKYFGDLAKALVSKVLVLVMILSMVLLVATM